MLYRVQQINRFFHTLERVEYRGQRDTVAEH